jgi:5-hydroxyisourate hydrolase
VSAITTHVLDTARGRPAAGIEVVLERAEGDGWAEAGRGSTDGDGRVRDLLADGPVPAGRYRLTFATRAYLDGGFWPEVTVTFELAGAEEHVHVPLLLSPYGYSAYRGS